MASAYGENHGLVCVGCGLRYDDMRLGISFKQARRDIIAIEFDRRRGKKKYGRRHGVLGFLFELKQSMWHSHVDECVSMLDARGGS